MVFEFLKCLQKLSIEINVTGGKRKEGNRENIGYKRHYSVCHGYKRLWEFALNVVRMEFMTINVITLIARERWR